MIGFNKVDLVERQPGVRPRLREAVDRVLPQIKGVPVVALSARTGEGLDRLMAAVMDAHACGTAAYQRLRSIAFCRRPRKRIRRTAVRGRRVRLDY